MAVIKISGLKKSYGKKEVLNIPDLQIRMNSISAFIGKNGAGKTTLMRILCGLQTPTEGSVQIEPQMSALIETPALYKEMNAKENMMQQFRIRGIKEEGKAEELLQLVGLENTGFKRVKNFSLGMKQKLAIAMTLVGNPKLIILDEPINGLDPQGINDLRDLIVKLNKEQNITFFISSHILDEMAKFCTDYIFIDEGRIIHIMTDEELKNQCEKYLHITVSNMEAFTKAAEENNWKYEVTGQDTAKLFEEVVITDFVNELSKYECQLMKCSNEEISLEDFCLNLVGGKA